MTQKHQVASYLLDTYDNGYCPRVLLKQGTRILGAFANNNDSLWLVVLEPKDQFGDHCTPTINVEYWVATPAREEIPDYVNVNRLSFVTCAVDRGFANNTFETAVYYVFVVEEDDIVCYPPSVRKPWETPAG